jgi:DNA-binding transcriptional ArsR family regulator/uncharacterized protein YndB with AHSA1/START domain
MTAMVLPTGGGQLGDADVWKALANPIRRSILDELRHGPRTTGELADVVPELSRFAVMQHLGVLTEAGLVVVRRRGRNRFNHLNPVPLRRWYERWVVPLADSAATEMLALQRNVEREAQSNQEGEHEMAVSSPVATDEPRTLRIETELRFRATPERVFEAITERSLEWYPSTYGGERVERVVVEPFVGGRHYEDWGDNSGYLYGQVVVWDPPRTLNIRRPLTLGVTLDTQYTLEAVGDETVLRMSKVAVGPMTDEAADGIRAHGDIANFEAALRRVIEG